MRLRGRPISITDDSLLDAARDVFLSRGLEATTQEIARRARISESVIFYRYKTKEALFAAVFERQIVLPEAFARLAEAAGKSTLAAHLLDAGRGVVTMMSAMMPFMMMAFSSPVKLSMVHQRTRQPHPVMGEMIQRLATYFKAEARLRGGCAQGERRGAGLDLLGQRQPLRLDAELPGRHRRHGDDHPVFARHDRASFAGRRPIGRRAKRPKGS